MAPKKKGNKKGQDDWEAELGETVAPDAAAAQPDAANDEEDGEDGSGGLMAMLRKNKQKRKERGLPEVEAAETPEQDPVIQAPQEANMDDEFALPEKKGKGGNKGKQGAKKEEGAGEEVNESGRVLTKAEKEKLKKEREKQRKKEQVSQWSPLSLQCPLLRPQRPLANCTCRHPKRRPLLQQRPPSQQRQRRRRRMKHRLLLRLQTRAERRRRFQPI